MSDHDDASASAPPAGRGDSPEEIVLPLHAERLNIETVSRETGEVTIRIDTTTTERLVDIPLRAHRVEVERRAVDLVVDELPRTRREGDTTIVPVVEEIVVTRYRIIEEVRITEIDEERVHREHVELRTETATILRNGKTA